MSLGVSSSNITSKFCSGWGTSLSWSASSGIPPCGSTYTHLHRCRADLVGDANHDTNSESFWTLFEVVIDIIEENHSSIVGHSFVPGFIACIKYILKEQLCIQIWFKFYSFIFLTRMIICCMLCDWHLILGSSPPHLPGFRQILAQPTTCQCGSIVGNKNPDLHLMSSD